MRKFLALTLLAGLFASGAAAEEKTESPDAPKDTKPAASATPLWKHTPGTYAVFETENGRIVCRLFPDKTPKTVANFTELAEGKRESVDPKDGVRKKRRLYDGTRFHRVIPGFMIQGGDPLGTGEGGPGYEFDDEIAAGLSFDKPGLLAMANAGLRPDGHGTNGSQFFITDTPRAGFNRLPTHLTGHHTIFGEVVEGQAVVSKIADTPTQPDSNGMALSPVTLKSVTIARITQPKDENAPAVAKKPAVEPSKPAEPAKPAESLAAPAAANAAAPASSAAGAPAPEATGGASGARSAAVQDSGSADAVRGAVETPKAGDKP